MCQWNELNKSLRWTKFRYCQALGPEPNRRNELTLFDNGHIKKKMDLWSIQFWGSILFLGWSRVCGKSIIIFIERMSIWWCRESFKCTWQIHNLKVRSNIIAQVWSRIHSKQYYEKRQRIEAFLLMRFCWVLSIDKNYDNVFLSLWR